ncbi:MAG: SDR family NAD(P)-dependent oxidoreductase [Dehalococcoidales bacterium]|jgi:NAD(P)-dependent dehydrogenase (short-subunit alcohol dehydrogenase family)
MLLKDKVAIITGGAKGMGRGMAEKFAEEGCAVAIADIAIKEAEEAAAAINKKKGGKALAIKCDVTSGKEVAATVAQVAREFKKIDILINNAGAIARHIPIEDMEEETWDRVMALNLKSHFLFCKYVVPYMKKSRYGKIIGLSSIGAVQPPAHEINYNTAKGAVISFTTDLANALAPFNINVNCILPGPIRTNFYDSTIGAMPKEQQEMVYTMMGRKTPLQRIGTPEDIAGAALFLASELSSYITGQALYVAGGLPLLPPAPLPREEIKGK